MNDTDRLTELEGVLKKTSNVITAAKAWREALVAYKMAKSTLGLNELRSKFKDARHNLCLALDML